MGTRTRHTFDAESFLDSAGIAKTIVEYRRGETIFSQGDTGDGVRYVQEGGVKLSVHSRRGREAVVAMLGPGEFFGEGCLAGQPVRTGSAIALTGCTILAVEKARMVRLLHKEPALADRFIAHMLARNIHIEEALVDQIFNSDEKGLARTLLRLTGYHKPGTPRRSLPAMSHETLANLAGTTPARVTVCMKKFERLGFVAGKRRLTIKSTLLDVVLRD